MSVGRHGEWPDGCERAALSGLQRQTPSVGRRHEKACRLHVGWRAAEVREGSERYASHRGDAKHRRQRPRQSTWRLWGRNRGAERGFCARGRRECFEGKREIAGGLETRRRRLFQASTDDASQPWWDVSMAERQIGGSSLRIALIDSTDVSRLNARCPDSISYRIAPNAKTSARWSAERPRTCSGAM